MCAQTWNIIGLLCGTAGILMLFVFGMPYRIRTGGMSFLALEEADEAELKQEKLFNALGWIGLVLVLIGTACQIVANMM